MAGYRLEGRIGRGGMAEVFRAWDERLDRQVALKILSPELAEDPVFRERFIRESRAAAAIQHPHIIPVFEAGEASSVLFIAMPLIDGGDAGSFVRRNGRLPSARVAEIVSQVASALDAAHAKGLVHRDVKPANMLLAGRPGLPDHVYLSDFGLTKAPLDSGGLTAAGQFLGTVDYAAPEQINGQPVDGRTDQYALGCSAFELLCGEPPFRREQVAATVHAHLADTPPLATSQLPGLASGVDRVFARVLAKSPADRYSTCQEFAEALRGALGPRPYPADAGDTPQERPANPVSPERDTDPLNGPVAPRNGMSPAMYGDTRPLDSADDQIHGAEVPPAESASEKVHAPVDTTKRRREKPRWPPQARAVVVAAVITAVIALVGTVAGVVITQILSHPQPTTGPTQTPTATPTKPLTPSTSPPSSPTTSAPLPTGPPSASVVTVLMADEAAASLKHHPADAVRLYVSTAFVRDDACGKPNQSTTWYGRDRILQRYQQLGAFSWLQHQNAEVIFAPNNAQAASATATAQTAGFIKPSPTLPAGLEIHGNERWTFIRVNGKWLISSFIYNVCLATG